MRRVIAAIVSTVAGLVLLLSFKTQSGSALAGKPAAVHGTSTGTTSTGTTGGAAAGGSAGDGSASGTPTGTASPTASSAGTSSGTRTLTGDEVDTRYGPVQVTITLTGGKITAADASEYPDSDGRSAQINAYAVPVLDSEAVAAGDASIDTVSGATYTSNGYLQSLQSALDKA